MITQFYPVPNVSALDRFGETDALMCPVYQNSTKLNLYRCCVGVLRLFDTSYILKQLMYSLLMYALGLSVDFAKRTQFFLMFDGFCFILSIITCTRYTADSQKKTTHTREYQCVLRMEPF